MASNSTTDLDVANDVADDVANIIDVEMLRLNLGALGDDANECLTFLVDIFVEDVPNLIQRLQTAIANQDANEARAAAHNLKSNSATLGATYMSTLCSDAENRARAGKVDDMAPLAEQIAVEFERAKAALDGLTL